MKRVCPNEVIRTRDQAPCVVTYKAGRMVAHEATGRVGLEGATEYPGERRGTRTSPRSSLRGSGTGWAGKFAGPGDATAAPAGVRDPKTVARESAWPPTA
ncbi:MAG: hypothetical protein VKP57_06635 [Candidatus Sericytochromatia bacterium]|nr:hypothetical protein [Candidatus Sericytochromatia bacterium]